MAGGPFDEALIGEDHHTLTGYVFTSTSKQLLMEGLAIAIQSRQVGFPDGPIVTELEQFEYVYTRTGIRYSAPEGTHDDCVCALALAVHHQRQANVDSQIAELMRSSIPLRQLVGVGPRPPDPGEWMWKR